ncbi:hypothetical protein HYX13_03875 [Candidatus Woesearchaeota archaeon]|nr:hypothetical protein [Candidatus Woesearchaeota archaeon]
MKESRNRSRKNTDKLLDLPSLDEVLERVNDYQPQREKNYSALERELNALRQENAELKKRNVYDRETEPEAIKRLRKRLKTLSEYGESPETTDRTDAVEIAKRIVCFTNSLEDISEAYELCCYHEEYLRSEIIDNKKDCEIWGDERFKPKGNELKNELKELIIYQERLAEKIQRKQESN